MNNLTENPVVSTTGFNLATADKDSLTAHLKTSANHRAMICQVGDKDGNAKFRTAVRNGIETRIPVLGKRYKSANSSEFYPPQEMEGSYLLTRLGIRPSEYKTVANTCKWKNNANVIDIHMKSTGDTDWQTEFQKLIEYGKCFDSTYNWELGEVYSVSDSIGVDPNSGEQVIIGENTEIFFSMVKKLKSNDITESTGFTPVYEVFASRF